MAAVKVTDRYGTSPLKGHRASNDAVRTLAVLAALLVQEKVE